MWICANDGFYSIVTDPKNPDNLLVRARRPGDIERLLGAGVEVVTIPNRDYMFRASVPRADVATALFNRIEDISYGNFKDSVRDHKLHDAYGSFWHTMARVQPMRPYSNYPQPAKVPAAKVRAPRKATAKPAAAKA